MNFTFFLAVTFTYAITSTRAMVSPSVTCCSDNGGTYQIVVGSDGDSGICIKDGVYYDEMTFLETNCLPSSPSPTPSPTESKYSVYTVNNCDNEVSAEFTLRKSLHGGNRNSSVDNLSVGSCAYVGPTNQDTITYTSEGSFVSGGNDSCANIGNSNDDECDLLGIADNACVITLC